VVLGVTPLRVGQEAYWLEQIARDACEYYSGKGESPGWWLGSLAEHAGLQGEASEEAVHRLFAGQDPVTGEQRVAPVWRSDPRSKLPAAPMQVALRELAAARGVDVGELAVGERDRRDLRAVLSARGRVGVATVERICRTVLGRNPAELYGGAYAEARKHAGRRVDARVASFDLSLSDPKSVSLLAAGSPPEVRAEVQAGRHAAIRQVLAGWNKRLSGSAAATTAPTASAAKGSPRQRSITAPAARVTRSGTRMCSSKTPPSGRTAAGRPWTPSGCTRTR
jgi:hypothetical protein